MSHVLVISWGRGPICSARVGATCPGPGCSSAARRAASPMRSGRGVARQLREVRRPLSRISAPRSTGVRFASVRARCRCRDRGRGK
jgi:hypothetical protein